MTSFAKAFNQTTNKTTTENGAAQQLKKLKIESMKLLITLNPIRMLTHFMTYSF